MTTQSVKRPTKRELVARAKLATQTKAATAATTPAVIAPPEPSIAEIAEAMDALDPVMMDEDEPDTDEWFTDSMDDELEEPGDVRERFAAATSDEEAPPLSPLVPPPAPRLVAASSGVLLAHCGTRKITRDELALVSTPEGTRTHQPVAHSRIVKLLEETLAFRHIHVTREEYAVSPDGFRMFGVLDLDYQYATSEGFRFSIGLRNSNDKTMRLGLTIGARVTVCDNMMFKGDFTPVLAKHSRKLDLEETIALGVERMQRGFAPLREQIGVWQRRALSDDAARLLIYAAFLDRGLPLPKHLMGVVHRHYFQPEYAAFKSRTLWSLSNAFTSAFKTLKPVRQFQATAKLGGFLARHEGNGSASHGQAYIAPPHEALAVSA